jgi:hypothetical protein
MKHGCTADPSAAVTLSSVLPRGMFRPVSVYLSDDGGEWVVRDYAGQSGRFCVIGPYTVDALASFPKLYEAHDFIMERAGKGRWLHRG